MTRALIIVAALAIGIALGAASQISPSVRNVLAATGLAGREVPQVSQDPAAPAAALKAPDRLGDEDQERAGRDIKMPPERIEAAKINVAPVGRGALTRKLTVPGTIIPNADRVARVPAKVVGTVAELRKRLGDPVKQGEVVAVLNSREVADAKSEYLTASVNFDLQKTMFERAQVLWDKRGSAEQQYLPGACNLRPSTASVRPRPPEALLVEYRRERAGKRGEERRRQPGHVELAPIRDPFSDRRTCS
jgi:cobalt-zinc-cadmium efflux system membrane fusion protein